MADTPNHEYNRPSKGAQDWDQPLNANFGALDTDVELRDSGTPSSNNYDPADGAKYLDTSSGVVYTGDGNSWTAAYALAVLDASGALTLATDIANGGSRALELGTPQTLQDGSVAGGNVLAGHPDNSTDDLASGAVIAGGGSDTEPNIVADNYGTIGGGSDNRAGTVGGRIATYATVSGGQGNSAIGTRATVGGGSGNTANFSAATVAGGLDNTASGINATVGGGNTNKADAASSTVPGGQGNIASGTYSFAAGQWAEADADWSFVWNDGSGESSDFGGEDDRFKATTSDASSNGSVSGSATFNVKATNGVRFITATDNSAVTYISDGGTGWNTASSRTVKTNIDSIDPEQALSGVEEMEVATWEYEGEGADTTYIGPMAEEFHDAFDVGSSDEHINSINADGVAFAAIQGLSAKLDDTQAELADARDELAKKDEQIESQAERIDELEERLAALEAQADTDERAPADD